VKSDTAALDRILADSYVDTDESGSRFDKPGVLAALESGDLKLASITLLETHVHRYGNSAVLTAFPRKPERSRVNRSHRRYFLQPPWFCKTGIGERSQHTERRADHGN